MSSHIKVICAECQTIVDAELQTEDVPYQGREVSLFTWHVEPCPVCIKANELELEALELIKKEITELKEIVQKA